MKMRYRETWVVDRQAERRLEGFLKCGHGQTIVKRREILLGYVGLRECVGR